MNNTFLLHFGLVKNWCNVVCFFFWMLAVAQFLSISLWMLINVGCKWGRFVCANYIRLCTCCNTSLWLGGRFGGCWSTSSSSTSCSSSKGAPCTLPVIMSSKIPSAVDAMFSCTGKKCYIPHCWITPWSPSKYSPWEGMRRCQYLVHPSKQFWNWFCGMAFRAAVVLLLMSSLSSKCFPYSISFIFGNRKKSLGARSGE